MEKESGGYRFDNFLGLETWMTHREFSGRRDQDTEKRSSPRIKNKLGSLSFCETVVISKEWSGNRNGNCLEILSD